MQKELEVEQQIEVQSKTTLQLELVQREKEAHELAEHHCSQMKVAFEELAILCDEVILYGLLTQLFYVDFYRSSRRRKISSDKANAAYLTYFTYKSELHFYLNIISNLN